MFTRNSCDDYIAEIISLVQQHYGNQVKVERGNGKYSQYNMEFKIKLSIPQLSLRRLEVGESSSSLSPQ